MCLKGFVGPNTSRLPTTRHFILLIDLPQHVHSGATGRRRLSHRGSVARGSPSARLDPTTPLVNRPAASTPLTAAARLRERLASSSLSLVASDDPSLAASGITGLGSSFAGITLADTPTHSVVGTASRASHGSSLLARRTGGTALQFMSRGTLASTRRTLGASSPPRASLGATSRGGGLFRDG